MCSCQWRETSYSLILFLASVPYMRFLNFRGPPEGAGLSTSVKVSQSEAEEGGYSKRRNWIHKNRKDPLEIQFLVFRWQPAGTHTHTHTPGWNRNSEYWTSIQQVVREVKKVELIYKMCTIVSSNYRHDVGEFDVIFFKFLEFLTST